MKQTTLQQSPQLSPQQPSPTSTKSASASPSSTLIKYVKDTDGGDNPLVAGCVILADNPQCQSDYFIVDSCFIGRLEIREYYTDCRDLCCRGERNRNGHDCTETCKSACDSGSIELQNGNSVPECEFVSGKCEYSIVSCGSSERSAAYCECTYDGQALLPNENVFPVLRS